MKSIIGCINSLRRNVLYLDRLREFMSVVPEFELGVWNAWILMLAYLSLFIVFGILDRLRGQKGSSRPMTPPLNEKERELDYLSAITFLASLVYSVVLPLDLGTGWLCAGSLFICSV